MIALKILLQRLFPLFLMSSWAGYYLNEVLKQNPRSQYLIRPVCGGAAILTILILRGEIKRYRSERKAKDYSATKIFRTEWAAYRGMGLCVATTACYLLLLPVIGFLPSTVLFLFTGFTSLKARIFPSAAISVVLTALVYYVFKVFLGVPLPSGFFFI